MSNTTYTTINTDSPSNYTVALDLNDNIIWSSELTIFTAGDLLSEGKSQAKTFVIGNNVTYLASAFAGHKNVKTIYVYNNEMKDLVYNAFKTIHQFDENTGVITNAAGEVVTVSVLHNEDNYIFDLYKSNRDITKPIHVSDFGARGSDSVYETGSINLGVLFVTTYGGKLMFESGTTYRITRPIRICPLEKNQYNTNIKNFDIDFNNCRIEVSTSPYHNGFDANDEKKNTMIYVNANFAEEERIGIIQNVELDTGVHQRVHTGMYLDSSSQISYKNIKIVDTVRGIYIAEINDKDNYTNEVFMDNITITKSIKEDGNLKFEEYPIIQEGENFDAESYFPDCKYVGLDCNASDCHFSNITVEDYLIGIRILGGDNRIKNAVVKNEHSPNQRKYSVGYINGGGNYYINCKVNDEECAEKEFYIGWMSAYAVPFFLNGCQWYGEGASGESNEESNEEFYVYYAFYINPDNYSGGGIYASGCSMTGPTDTKASMKFSNVENYDIKYSGTISNVETKD